LIRVAVVAAIVTAGALAPTKHLDHNVGPFEESILLSELLQKVHVYCDVHAGSELDRTIHLPPGMITKRELLRQIEKQTGWKFHIGYCGNSVTILGGACQIVFHLERGDRTEPDGP